MKCSVCGEPYEYSLRVKIDAMGKTCEHDGRASYPKDFGAMSDKVARKFERVISKHQSGQLGKSWYKDKGEGKGLYGKDVLKKI